MIIYLLFLLFMKVNHSGATAVYGESNALSLRYYCIFPRLINLEKEESALKFESSRICFISYFLKTNIPRRHVKYFFRKKEGAEESLLPSFRQASQHNTGPLETNH